MTETSETTIWTTKKGQRIPIGQMADQHLKNTIALLERTEGSDEQKRVYPALVAEFRRRQRKTRRTM